MSSPNMRGAAVHEERLMTETWRGVGLGELVCVLLAWVSGRAGYWLLVAAPVAGLVAGLWWAQARGQGRWAGVAAAVLAGVAVDVFLFGGLRPLLPLGRAVPALGLAFAVAAWSGVLAFLLPSAARSGWLLLPLGFILTVILSASAVNYGGDSLALAILAGPAVLVPAMLVYWLASRGRPRAAAQDPGE